MDNTKKKTVHGSYTLGAWGKLAIFVLFLTQVIRLVCIAGSYYHIYDSLIVKKVDAAFFDGSTKDVDYSAYYPQYVGDNSGSAALATFSPDSFDIGDSSSSDNKSVKDAITTMDILNLLVPALDIITSAFAIWIITVPLSRLVGLWRWIKWVIRSRLIWMRILWVLTASAYATIFIKYRRRMYATKNEEKYYDKTIVFARIVLIPIEYGFLGILETVSRIYTCDRVNDKVKEGRHKLSKFWGRVAWFTYLIALLDFALRNFSVSFYFGLYSVILAEDNSGDREKNVLVVLQIYLAIMRGKFFQFFLRLFLGNYVFEDDDEQFNIPSKSHQNVNGDDFTTPADPDQPESEQDKYAQWFEQDQNENNQEHQPFKV